MNKRNLVLSLAFSLMLATNVMAGNCEKNFKQVDVSGKVNTQSYTAALQAGNIAMQLTSVQSGKVLFDRTGAVMGEITLVGYDPEASLPFALLDHDITFGDGFGIETSGDRATIYGDPSGSDVFVVEAITNFRGSKTFKNATGEITATGFLNIGGSGRNEFDLSGSLCIKP